MKKPQKSVADAPLGVPGRGSMFLGFNKLWEFLTADRYDGGETRQRATLLVFADGSQLKLCLSDRDNDLIAFVAGDNADEALAVLEEQLATERVIWRPQQGRQQRKK